jgi:prepilin-type N-terminal cleavage/methylation domain-containing protein
MKIRECRTESGFTLFEIIIAIAVVGLIMGIAVSGMDRYLETEMKAASNKLASTVRYVYNKAATEGLYVRMVFDLSEHTYWVEATTDPVKVEKQDAGSSARARGGKDKKKDQKEDEDASKTEGDETRTKGMFDEDANKIKPKEVVFGAIDSFLLKPTKLPDGIFFKDIYVEHLIFPADGGKVSIFFFPNGYVEEAVINLRDEGDEINYSLKTNPVSGRVNIENFYRKLEER